MSTIPTMEQDGTFAWTAKVGEKGQIVIPKRAREFFGIRPGDTLLLLGDREPGIAIIDSAKLVGLAQQVLRADDPPPAGGEGG